MGVSSGAQNEAHCVPGIEQLGSGSATSQYSVQHASPPQSGTAAASMQIAPATRIALGEEFRMEAGANVDLADKGGWTALMYAASQGSSPCVSALLEADANLFIQTCFNYPTLSELYKYATYDALGKLNGSDC